jgi:phage regulator Rha-like protein
MAARLSTTSTTSGTEQLDSSGADLALTMTTTGARIDSRLLAAHMGNGHKAVMGLLDRYLGAFRTHGQLTFQKEVGDRRQGGGNAERYALLNEDQAYFLLSLSRNSEIVVALKSKLIAAFSEARRATDMRQREYPPDLPPPSGCHSHQGGGVCQPASCSHQCCKAAQQDGRPGSRATGISISATASSADRGAIGGGQGDGRGARPSRRLSARQAIHAGAVHKHDAGRVMTAQLWPFPTRTALGRRSGLRRSGDGIGGQHGPR